MTQVVLRVTGPQPSVWARTVELVSFSGVVFSSVKCWTRSTESPPCAVGVKGDQVKFTCLDMAQILQAPSTHHIGLQEQERAEGHTPTNPQTHKPLSAPLLPVQHSCTPGPSMGLEGTHLLTTRSLVLFWSEIGAVVSQTPGGLCFCLFSHKHRMFESLCQGTEQFSLGVDARHRSRRPNRKC